MILTRVQPQFWLILLIRFAPTETESRRRPIEWGTQAFPPSQQISSSA